MRHVTEIKHQSRLQEIFQAPEETTYEFLTGTLGLSGSMVERFFAPFYQVTMMTMACGVWLNSSEKILCTHRTVLLLCQRQVAGRCF